MESEREKVEKLEKQISTSIEEIDRNQIEKFVNLIAELVVEISIREYHAEKGNKIP